MKTDTFSIFKTACNKYKQILQDDDIKNFLLIVSLDDEFNIQNMADDFAVICIFGFLIKYDVIPKNDIYRYMPILMQDTVKAIKFCQKNYIRDTNSVYLQCESIKKLLNIHCDVNINIDFNDVIDSLEQTYKDVDFSTQINKL